eukprot:855817_1
MHQSNSIHSIDNNNDNIPLGIPTYSLQQTNETNISSELSLVNDNINMDNVSPIEYNINKNKLICHKSYNSAPVNHQKITNVCLRQNKSYGDELKSKNNNNNDYGL